eukprot:5222548-Pleurochrysis_carterae.AAC.1
MPTSASVRARAHVSFSVLIHGPAACGHVGSAGRARPGLLAVAARVWRVCVGEDAFGPDTVGRGGARG